MSADGGLFVAWLLAVYPLAMVFVGLSLRESYMLKPGTCPPLPATFMELRREARRHALELAWTTNVPRGEEPLAPRCGPSGAEWTWTLGGALAIGAILAAFLDSTRPQYESFEWSIFAAVDIMGLASCVVGGLAFAAFQRGRPAATFASYETFWRRYLEQRELYEHRQLAVTWVNAQLEAWRGAAYHQCIGEALGRFALAREHAEAFTLEVPHDEPPYLPDMPPAKIELVALCVGPYLGIRHRFFLDVRDTSHRVGVSEQAGTAAKAWDATEIELHYRDIVTVEYRRFPPHGYQGVRPLGTFHLGLVNGRVIEYPTMEYGASSCVDAIRAQTRLKARG